MKKIINNDGGMPGKVTDLCLLQDTAQLAVALILNNMMTEANCIVSGLVKTFGGGNIEVTEGYFFDGTEIHYIPAASFVIGAEKELYIIANPTTEENRHFHDTTDHDVWQNNDYALGYDREMPSGSISYDSLLPLSNQINNILAIVKEHNHFTGSDAIIPFDSPFTAATIHGAMDVMSNSFDDIMIIAAFYATGNGKIGTLPIAFRPSGDLEVAFYAAGAIGILKIKANGELWVLGVNTSGGVNYITCQFQRIFNDAVQYHLPASAPLPDLPDSNKIVQSNISEDAAFEIGIRAGRMGLYILIENTTTNTAYLTFAVTEGSNELGAHITINPKVGDVNGYTTILINKVFSLDTDTPVFINHSAEGDEWNSAILNITIKMAEI